MDTSRRARSATSRCTDVHRAMTSFTGSVPARPKEPASRVVVNARIPQLSKSGTTSFGTSVKLVAAIVNASDRRSESVESLVDALVAALDLADVVDEARTLGAKRGEKHRHAGADVRRLEERATEARWTVDERAVRIAKDDARTHRRQLVHEEHSRLEHLLVHQDDPFALRGGNDRDRHRIRREGRPRLVLELRDMAAHVALDLERLLGRDNEVGTVLDAFDAEAREAHARRAKVLDAGVLDSKLRPGHGGEADERADLDVIGTDTVARRFGAQLTITVDRHGVRADALDVGAERDEEVREILDVGLAGGVSQHGRAPRGGGGNERVLRRRDTGFVEENIRAAEAVDLHVDHLAVRELRTELLEREEVGVESAAADHIPARRRERHLPATRKQGSSEQNRRANLGAKCRIEIGGTEIPGVNVECVLTPPLHRRSDRPNELDEGLHVADARYVFEVDGVRRKERSCHDRQRRIFVS